MVVFVDEGAVVDPIASLPADRVIGFGFLDVEGKRMPIIGQAGSELIGRVQNPGVAGLGGKKHERPDVDDTPIVLGGAMLDGTDLGKYADLIITKRRNPERLQ